MARRRAAAAFSPGTLVAGRYSLERKLGEGGMAVVFAATDTQTGRRVAIKLLHQDVATNPEAVERTKREGQILKELDNPAIVNVETFGELDDGTVFLVMELLEGETLGERMRRGTLDPVELAPIVAGTCAGLHAAHAKGVVHRDLKPDNVFLCRIEHGMQVKLLDFGISKVYGSKTLTQTGEVLGTPRYMSPEQLGAEPDVDARVDIYALGVILYEALAGKPPFLAATPTELIIAILNGKVAPLGTARPDCPPNVEGVVMRAMSKVRTARYETAMQLADAYIDAVGGPSAVRAQQRRGMATQVFGGVKIDPAAGRTTQLAGMPAATEPHPKDSVAGNLKLGTFSGLAASPATSEPVAPLRAGTQQMGASPGGIVPPGKPEPVVAEPHDEHWDASGSSEERPVPRTREAPMEIPATPVPSSSAARLPVPATAMMGASQPLPGDASRAPAVQRMSSAASPAKKRGTGIGKIFLVAAALVAGAVSAGAVILALSLASDEAGETASEVVEEPVVLPVPAVTVTELRDAAAPPHTENHPEPVAVQPEPEPEPTVEEATEHTHRRRRRRRRPPVEDDDPPAGDDPPDEGGFLPGFGNPTEPGDPPPEEDMSPIAQIRQARRELRRGRPRQCVALLDDAISRGAPAIALARRGDCYEAMGQRGLAIRDYQRFCRIAHDHPAIADVRPRLESWGQRCE